MMSRKRVFERRFLIRKRTVSAVMIPAVGAMKMVNHPKMEANQLPAKESAAATHRANG
jgi:hypothetical protein